MDENDLNYIGVKALCHALYKKLDAGMAPLNKEEKQLKKFLKE